MYFALGIDTPDMEKICALFLDTWGRPVAVHGDVQIPHFGNGEDDGFVVDELGSRRNHLGVE